MAYQIESGSCTGRGFSAVDTDGFLAKFYTWVTKAPASGGPGWYIIDDQSALGTDPYIVVCDVAVPVVNDIDTGQNGMPPKFIKIGMVNTDAGYVQAFSYMWWDSTAHTGEGLFYGTKLVTYDSAEFAYDFRGGTECMIIQSRTGTNWSTFVFDEWTGDPNLVEGTDKVGTFQSGITAGSNVTVQLDTGEAANFTANKYYFIYDFSTDTWVDYTYVVSVDLGLDQIVLYDLDYNFPSGSVISSYAHRFYCVGDDVSNTNNFSVYASVIPYTSSTVDDRVVHNQTGYVYGSVKLDYPSTALTAMSPDDYSFYGVSKPLVVEYSLPNISVGAGGSTTGANRAYGVANNLYVTYKGSMAAGLDGKTISTNNWLYFRPLNDIVYSGSSSFASLFLDTEST